MNMIKIGPFGGLFSGTAWNEMGYGQVGGVLVNYGPNIIHALRFMYYENGTLIVSNKHGATGRDGDFCSIVFDYPSEFLTSISGSYSDTDGHLKSIKFNTNKGYYGPFGTRPSVHIKEFNFHIGNQCLFGGFHGTENDHGVESIGVYVRTNTYSSSIIPTWRNFTQDSQSTYF